MSSLENCCPPKRWEPQNGWWWFYGFFVLGFIGLIRAAIGIVLFAPMMVLLSVPHGILLWPVHLVNALWSLVVTRKYGTSLKLLYFIAGLVPALVLCPVAIIVGPTLSGIVLGAGFPWLYTYDDKYNLFVGGYIDTLDTLWTNWIKWFWRYNTKEAFDDARELCQYQGPMEDIKVVPFLRGLCAALVVIVVEAVPLVLPNTKCVLAVFTWTFRVLGEWIKLWSGGCDYKFCALILTAPVVLILPGVAALIALISTQGSFTLVVILCLPGGVGYAAILSYVVMTLVSLFHDAGMAASVAYSDGFSTALRAIPGNLAAWDLASAEMLSCNHCEALRFYGCCTPRKD